MLSTENQKYIQTASALALAAYGKEEAVGKSEILPPGNWNLVDDPRLKNISKASGYQARVYVNADTKQLWLANAGTNDPWDVASWPGAVVGWEVGKDQYRDALATGKIVNDLVKNTTSNYIGYTVNTSGHSWGELLSQMQAYTFGWKGVGFDGPGAGQIINSAGYEQELRNQNIQSVRAADFTSCNTAGIWIFGGGIVGSAGSDIVGTQQCNVTVERSASSAQYNLLFSLLAGLPGYLISKLLGGVLLHDMKENINPAVQAGKFDLGVPPSATPTDQPFDVNGGAYDALGNYIGDIQSAFNQAETTTSPLILDLDGDGVKTISKNAGIHFDHDGNHFAETTDWVDKDDALLAGDKNGNGQIDNGFAALAELDSNGDSKIDAGDAAFTQLRVWKNGDSNAVVPDGELLALNEAGVQNLGLAFTSQSQTDARIPRQGVRNIGLFEMERGGIT